MTNNGSSKERKSVSPGKRKDLSRRFTRGKQKSSQPLGGQSDNRIFIEKIFHTVFLIATGSFSLLNAKSAVGLWWILRDPSRDHLLRLQDPSIARSATVGRPRMNTSRGNADFRSIFSIPHSNFRGLFILFIHFEICLQLFFCVLV